MGDSDEEYDRRKGRDKFRRERNDYDHRGRDERRRDPWEHERTTGAVSTNGAIFCGNSNLEIFLDDVRCLGNESSIHICDHRWWKEHDCTHSEDAGVRCDTYLVFQDNLSLRY